MIKYHFKSKLNYIEKLSADKQCMVNQEMTATLLRLSVKSPYKDGIASFLKKC